MSEMIAAAGIVLFPFLCATGAPDLEHTVEGDERPQRLDDEHAHVEGLDHGVRKRRRTNRIEPLVGVIVGGKFPRVEQPVGYKQRR